MWRELLFVLLGLFVYLFLISTKENVCIVKCHIVKKWLDLEKT